LPTFSLRIARIAQLDLVRSPRAKASGPGTAEASVISACLARNPTNGTIIRSPHSQIPEPPRLLIEPDILHAPAVEQAV
jgi:hypothetical protein